MAGVTSFPSGARCARYQWQQPQGIIQGARRPFQRNHRSRTVGCPFMILQRPANVLRAQRRLICTYAPHYAGSNGRTETIRRPHGTFLTPFLLNDGGPTTAPPRRFGHGIDLADRETVVKRWWTETFTQHGRSVVFMPSAGVSTARVNRADARACPRSHRAWRRGGWRRLRPARSDGQPIDDDGHVKNVPWLPTYLRRGHIGRRREFVLLHLVPT